MRSVDDHLRDILDTVRPLPPIDLRLVEASGCLLAEYVSAADALPAFDNSAMDGYAVRADDVADASEDRPATLHVVGDIAAGSTGIYTVRPGMCARIMTGAPVPSGADAVVPVEWTDGGMAKVKIRLAPTAGQHIRRRGEDVDAGAVVLRPGVRLGPAQVGLLAAVGKPRVRVRPRPRVLVFSTGSELAEPGTPLEPGQITDSNSFTLTTAAIQAGCIGYRYGIVPDDPHTLLSTIEDQLVRADAVVTSGGVSMGAYDVVKEVLSRLGTVSFERVAMQPGMPQGFGTIGPDKTPIFTLPGNPVSAYVSFQVFVRPALDKLRGLAPRRLPTVRARLTGPLTSPEGKRSYARGRLARGDDGGWRVAPVGGHGSHLLASLAAANALVVVPEETTRVPEGEEVQCLMVEETTHE